MLRFLIRLLLTIALVSFMATSLDQYFFVTGGTTAYVIIGTLIAVMNVIVSPVLDIVIAPLKLLATMLAIILTNTIFLYLTVLIVSLMPTSLVTLDIQGGIAGWIVIALVLGLAKWAMKTVLKKR